MHHHIYDLQNDKKCCPAVDSSSIVTLIYSVYQSYHDLCKGVQSYNFGLIVELSGKMARNVFSFGEPKCKEGRN